MNLRIAVIGAGAVGGYFGGRLAQAGAQVAFVARGAQLTALRTQGLRVASIAGDFALDRVTATDQPAEIGPVDYVIVAVKAWQVPEVATTLGPLLDPETAILPLENGVEAADQLGQVLAPERVLGGLCRIISFVAEPGVIRHVGATPLVALGEFDGRRTARLVRLQEALERAGVSVETPADIVAALWEKLLFIAPFGGVGAVARAPIGVIRALPGTRSLIERAMHEIHAVARARGVRMAEDTVARALTYIDTLPPAGTASLQRDLAAGRPSELEALIGVVVRLGAAQGVATPVHTFLHDTLLPGELRARGQLQYPT
jgi:2-dehydropantoate 2-reductase